MTMLSPSRAEEALHHVVQQFTQWRRSRSTPRGRIPPALWEQAVALTRANSPSLASPNSLGSVGSACASTAEERLVPPASPPCQPLCPLWKYILPGACPRRR